MSVIPLAYFDRCTTLSRFSIFASIAKSPLRALVLLCARAYRRVQAKRFGETMELLELAPPDFGVSAAGLYIIDDDGLRPLAGPFTSESAAIARIVQRQDRLSHTAMESAVRQALTVQAALA